MKWILGEPKSGDMIRVKAGTIHHYGVFVSDSEVIQFGLAPNARPELKDSDIEVLSTDIDTFLQNQFLEVAEFDRKEKVAAVTRLYNEIGIDKMAQDKIAYYFEQSKKYLDAVNVPAERKEELAKYAQKMMKRQY